MEVILLEKIPNLGDLGDTVKVKPGYGRNYLIPSRKAMPATDANLAIVEEKRAELEKIQAEALKAAEARAATLAGAEVTIEVRAGSEGKLFGSVGTNDIADALVAAGYEVEKREVRLPDGPVREVGQYQIDLELHADLLSSVTVNVSSDGTVVTSVADDDDDDEYGDEYDPQDDGDDTAPVDE